jgi:hypothetical protein
MFCSRTVYGNSLRAHSAEYTFEMIKDLYLNFGIREIQIRDDNFVTYRQRLVRLCEILKREKLGLVWTYSSDEPGSLMRYIMQLHNLATQRCWHTPRLNTAGL